jgi:hypothetical protein
MYVYFADRGIAAPDDDRIDARCDQFTGDWIASKPLPATPPARARTLRCRCRPIVHGIVVARLGPVKMTPWHPNPISQMPHLGVSRPHPVSLNTRR